MFTFSKLRLKSRIKFFPTLFFKPFDKKEPPNVIKSTKHIEENVVFDDVQVIVENVEKVKKKLKSPALKKRKSLVIKSKVKDKGKTEDVKDAKNKVKTKSKN